jgi:hypothetical protein
MKSKLVATVNVVNADRVMDRLKSKDKPGMIVIYGETGVGKTFYSYNRTFSNGWCYYRLRATETAKSFLQQVYKRLNRIYTGSNEILRGNTAKLEEACIQMFKKMPNQVFAVDEMNLATQFRKWDIIEVIRDFRDEAHAQIILIGEHDTRQKLEAYNQRYFGRCEFVPFTANSVQDVALVLKSCSEVDFAEDVYKTVVSKFKGNLRQVENFIQDAEVTAEEKGLEIITMKDLKI